MISVEVFELYSQEKLNLIQRLGRRSGSIYIPVAGGQSNQCLLRVQSSKQVLRASQQGPEILEQNVLQSSDLAPQWTVVDDPAVCNDHN